METSLPEEPVVATMPQANETHLTSVTLTDTGKLYGTFAQTEVYQTSSDTDSVGDRIGATADRTCVKHWLLAQLQLPGFVPEEHWTSEHTAELINFCTSSKRKYWFLWMDRLPSQSHQNVMEAHHDEAELLSHGRLRSGNWCPTYDTVKTLQPTSLHERGAERVVFIVKRKALVSVHQPLAEQLLCLSLDGNFLEQTATLIRGICIPLLRKNYFWAESLKKDFARQLSTYAGQLIDVVHRTRGPNTLALPYEDLNNIAQCLSDRDLIQRLEGVVSLWTRQLKETVALQDEPGGSFDLGHLAEIQRWTEHAQTLNALIQQFHEPATQDVLRLLEAAKSSHVKPFLLAQKDVKATLSLAAENLKVLQILKAPCQAFLAADSQQAPRHIAELLMAVRIIATHSKYYTTPERIGGLLRNIAYEIIRRGQTSIDVDALWAGDVTLTMESLQQSIQWGAILNKTFRQLSTLIKAEGRVTCPWGSADTSAFAASDAFVQRCTDLFDVCLAQLQFSPLKQFKGQGMIRGSVEAGKGENLIGQGHNLHCHLPFFGAFQTEAIRGYIHELQSAFLKVLARLKEMGRSVLEVKQTNWHTEYAVFKEQVRDLECMYTNVITTAFKRVSTVEEACEIYDAFQVLATRPKIRRFLEKKAVDVWRLFSEASNCLEEPFWIASCLSVCETCHIQSVTSIKRQFDLMKRSRIPFLSTKLLHPNQSGASLWCRGAAIHLQRQLQALHGIGLPADSRDAEQASELYSNVSSMLQQSFVEKSFQEWLQEVEHIQFPVQSSQQSELPQFGCDTYILSRRKGGSLELNFDKTLQRGLQEARFWQFLQGQTIHLPFAILEVMKHQDHLFLLRHHVLRVVDERRLFQQHLKALDRRAAPGLQRLTWNSRGIREFFVRDMWRECQTVIEYISRFQDAKKKISVAVQASANVHLINIDRKSTLELNSFLLRQAEERALALSALEKHYNDVLQYLRSVEELFEDQSSDAQKEWTAFVSRVDLEWREALRKAIQSSFLDLASALSPRDSKRNSVEAPALLRIFAVIKTDVVSGDDSQIAFEPSLERLRVAIEGTCRDAMLTLSRIPKICNPVEFHEHLNAGEADPRKAHSWYLDIACDAECEKLLGQILRCVSSTSSKLVERLTWWSTNYSCLLEETEGGLSLLLQRSKQPSQLVVTTIQQYSEYRVDIQQEESKTIVCFLEGDFNKLKQSLLDHCHLRQNFLKLYLHDQAKKEQDAVFTFIATNRQVLEKAPLTTDELRDRIHLCSRCKEQLPAIRKRLEPIQGHFNTLQDLGVSISEEDRNKLETLKPELDGFQATLEAAEILLVRTKKTMKADAELLVSSLTQRASELFKQFMTCAPFDGGSFNYNTATAFQILQGYKAELSSLSESGKQLAPILEFFGIENSDSRDIVQMEKDSDKLGAVWLLKDQWDQAWNSISIKPFYSLDVPELQALGDGLAQRLLDVGEGKAWPIWRKIYNELEHFRQTLPLISKLLDPAIRERHWERIKTEIAESFDQSSPDFNLKSIFQYELLRRSDLIARLADEARKELKIEIALNEIVDVWASLQLNIVPYKTTMLRMEIKEELLTTLEEHLLSLSTIKSDPFHLPFKDFVASWESTLSIVSEMLELLQQVQRQWVSLENVFRGKLSRTCCIIHAIPPDKWLQEIVDFGSEDIRILLPQEATLFDRTDKLYYFVLLGLQQASTLVDGCTQPGMKVQLRLMNDDLEEIQKSLDDYLERKRQEFPRLYFVSNSDMLEILGDAKDPEKIQRHINKLFQGIKSLELVPPGRRGTRCWEAEGFISSEGERIRFASKPIAVEGGVEQWLTKVMRAMRETLRKQLVAVQQQSMAHGTKRDKWIKENCFQLVITSSQITWTMDTEVALRRISRGNKLALKSLKRQQSRELLHLTELVRKAGSDRERMKLNALVTVEVHNRDIQAVQTRCDSEHHFAWTSQLRLELREDTGEGDKGGTLLFSQPGFSGTLVCQCLQMETVTPYGYEYQGIYSRLVITPLTDQCFMALTFALHFKLGGSCQGPAGSGKTETVKDLGKTLARFVIVFNCSDALDYLSLGRIFSGLAQSGAWCCFDEFNRIGLEVLSVVAQQISTIQNALREIQSDEHNQRKFFFEGQRVPLDPGCGIFTTMNPGYRGRAELPDNLKSLFRPVAMMSPDTALICEVLLMAEGFDSARALSRKLVTLFQLMAQQLSKQDHYDFGLRPIRAALQRAGEIKRRADGKTTEQGIVIQAVNDMIVPKTISDDLEIFFGLIKDIFSEGELLQRQSEVLREALESIAEQRGWTRVEHQIQKSGQLLECIQTRHGNMLVGSTLSGKTTVLTMLEQALTLLNARGLEYNSIKAHVLNPRSLNGAELYGGFSSMTREWTDGIFSALLRTCCNEAQQHVRCSRWVVLDGPVDTSWVESMNSLLDDNKTLTLTNGDRIELHSQVSLLFEVEDLSAASPATVSRVGIIFMDPTSLSGNFLLPTLWNAHVATNREHKGQERLTRSSVAQNFPHMAGKRHRTVGLQLQHLFVGISWTDTSACFLQIQASLLLMERTFLFSLLWSVGATVAGNSRPHFDLLLRQLSNCFPPSHTVYDYCLTGDKGDWTLWEDRVPSPYRPLEGMQFHRIFVPTADVVCHSFLLGSLIKSKIHALAVGTRGCGKTSCIQKAVLHDLPDSVYSTSSIIFSSQMSSREAQERFESNLEKRAKGKWGPPGRKSLVCFVDDLNMPKRDEFGCQPPLELLRHFLEHGCWYDRNKQTLKVVLDTHILAAMMTPEGGRASISPRLQSRFNIISFQDPSVPQLDRIYQILVVHKFSDFKEDVKNVAENIASATVSLHFSVLQAFRPKPERPHYLFSMRDMSKVVQGLYQADPRCIEDREALLKLWYHESQRVYQDRLASAADAARFAEILDSLLEKCFQIRTKDLTKDKTVLFSHMRVEQSGALTLGEYEEVQDHQALKMCLQHKLNEINASSKTGALNLVLFREAVEKCCRIHRTLSTPRGHMLLIGIGGSGRQTLAAFATKLAKFELWRIHAARNYSLRDFLEELKQLIVMSGKTTWLDGDRITLVISDKDLKTDAFSDSLNSLLCSGHIPGLFDTESLSLLLRDLQPAAKAARLSTEPEALLELFISRIRENLHVLLCFSPINSKICDYCRLFPAFINDTSIDWYFTWPQDALEEVATSFLSFANFEFPDRTAIARACSQVHMHAFREAEAFQQEEKRTSFVTPPKFLRLVNGYRSMLESKRNGVQEKIQKLASGLCKLVEARQQLETMNEELEIKKEDVARKQRECDELMVVIAEKRMLADEQMKQVKHLRVVLTKREEVETKILSEEARRDLAKALPALEAAIDALEKLDKKSVAEVKAYTKPPGELFSGVLLVMKTMAAVMTVMEKTPSWSQAKIELNDPSFLTRVKNFEKDSVTNATLKKIEKFTKDPLFAPPNVQKVSRAAGALCLWVHAMQMYAEVYREVEPKRLKLRLAEEQLEKKQNDLRIARSRLDDIQGRLQELNNQYSASLHNKGKLNNSAEELRVKLERAESLITGLADERDRWELSLERCRADLRNIRGDALLGAAFLSYAGPFTSSYRARLVKDLWIGTLQGSNIPFSLDFDFTDFLVTPLEVRQWQLHGLPIDPFSAENGVLITKASKWPLVLDPQNQANRWIRKLKAADNITIVDPESKALMRILHLSVQTGRAVLLERLRTQIDPSLEALITKKIVFVNGCQFISIGDQLVPCDSKFSLWMTTKIGNPRFPPEIEADVTLVNFVIMQDGLTEQLLGVVVMKEQPSLEAHKHALVQRLAEGRKRLQDIEDQILRLLTDARGSLLDDVELIKVLQDSKHVAEDVSSQLEVSERTMKKIDQAREAYRPCGHRASVLYFVLQDLALADSMYQFSLDAYEDLFVASISKAKESNAVAASAEEHVLTLSADHTLAVYRHARQAVFERHKPLLSLHLCASVLLSDDQLNRQEYSFLFTCGGAQDPPLSGTSPDPEWITPTAWQLICKADKLDSLQGLQNSLEQNLREWRRWFNSQEPERASLPGDWQPRLDDLQRLIVIRCLRPDRIIPATSRFVAEALDAKFVESATLNWEELFVSSKSCVPLLFILSGVDPVGQLTAFASSKNITVCNAVLSVALGQGQAMRAEQVIRDGARHGFWVYLANCHLAIYWLPALEKLVEEVFESQLHPDFRLWLSSEPTELFPIGLLQRSTKISVERPRGLKANLLRLLQQRTEDEVQRLTTGEERYRRLFFSLCWFHSLLVERGKFHNVGWNTHVSFSDSDFLVGDNLLAAYCEQSTSELPWEAIRFRIVGGCYGGRLATESDMKLLRVYCNDCFNPQLLTNEFGFQGFPQYPFPQDTSLNGLCQYVRDLPSADPPEAFGQHVNAEIQLQITEAEELFATLCRIQLSGVHTANDGSKEPRELRALKCCDHLDQLLFQQVDVAALKQAGENNVSPLRIVLLQEAQRLNRLVACVRGMVQQLRKSISGFLVMSEDLEALQASLLNGKVPECWHFAFPSLKPLTSWATDMCAELHLLRCLPQDRQPKAFWLGGFTYPSAFLTALLQQFARRNGLPIDTISFEFIAQTTYDENMAPAAPRDGAYVKRLFLEGASWNLEGMFLAEPEPMQLLHELPIIHLKPVARKRAPADSLYMCPVYMYPCRTGTSQRSSLVTIQEIRSGAQDPSFWVKRGTAILLSTAS
ncbi:hypothetical protein Efla_004062 [Eimeria flavescens]